MIDNVVLVSGVQKSDSVIHIHVSVLFQILFRFRLLHYIEQSSLCYTVGPCWLSILNIAVPPLLLKIKLMEGNAVKSVLSKKCIAFKKLIIKGIYVFTVELTHCLPSVASHSTAVPLLHTSSLSLSRICPCSVLMTLENSQKHIEGQYYSCLFYSLLFWCIFFCYAYT